MDRIAKKLKSQRGASLLIVLLLFLVCAFVGGAVLTSAYQNASRAPSIRQAQQRYLAVSSAAQLLKEQLTGQSIRLQHITQSTYTLYGDGTQSAPSTTSWSQLAQSYPGVLDQLSQDALRVFQGGQTGGPYAMSFDVDGYPALSGVTGELSMTGGEAGSYGVTALLRDEAGGNELRLTFSFSAANDGQGSATTEEAPAGEEETQVTATTIRTTTVTWTGASVRLNSIPTHEEGTPWTA